MITIGMLPKTENKDIGYFAMSANGYKTGLEFGWSGLLKVVGDASHFERVAEALELSEDDLVNLIIDLYLERLVDDLLQLRAEEMTEDYALLIDLETTGDFRYAFLDPAEIRSSSSWTDPGSAVIASRKHASRLGY